MLFVYGTLQDEDVLAAVLGRVVSVGDLIDAISPDHRAVIYPGRVYPALVGSPGDSAPGRLIGALSEIDLAVLDAFEGAEYRRAKVVVDVEGQAMVAESYLPTLNVAADGPAWTLANWTQHHKHIVLAEERRQALALRQALMREGCG